PRSIFFGPRSDQNQSQNIIRSILTHFEQGLNVLCNSDWLQFPASPQLCHGFRWVKVGALFTSCQIHNFAAKVVIPGCYGYLAKAMVSLLRKLLITNDLNGRFPFA